MPSPSYRGRLVDPDTWERQHEDEAEARVQKFVDAVRSNSVSMGNDFDPADLEYENIMDRYRLRRNG